MKKQRFLLSLLILSLFLSLISCRREAAGTDAVLKKDTPYPVLANFGGLETEGVLSIEEGRVRFVHKSNSCRDGMEEIYEDGTLSVRYGGIEWSSDEVRTDSLILLEAIEALGSAPIPLSPTTPYEGQEALAASLAEAGREITLIVKKDTLTPLKILARCGEKTMSVIFSPKK